jgi:plastocyanin
LVFLLVLTLLCGGVTAALAQPPSSTGDKSVAPAEPACEAEPCEAEPTPNDPTPMPPVDSEEPTDGPDEEVVDGEAEEPVAEPLAEPLEVEAPDAEAEAAQSAQRAALALADSTVDIVDFDYRPGMVTINAGDTVTWTQSGDAPHTVTADDGSFDSGELTTGGNFSMRFDEAGTYRYYCTLHGGPGGEGMSAVVTVEAAQTSEEPPSVDPAVEETTAPSVDGSLPDTGGGPPSPWIFAIALVVSGVVLWRVGRLADEVDEG